MSKIEELESFLSPLVEAESMELVDVQYLSECGKKVLRVFIDKEGGINLSDCERLSSVIGDALDNNPVIPSAYVLEVSSPGIDRALKKEKDFIKYTGSRCRINLFSPIEGQRNFFCKILEVSEGKIKVYDSTGKTVNIEISKIAKARLEPEVEI